VTTTKAVPDQPGPAPLSERCGQAHRPNPPAAIHMAALAQDVLIETNRTYFHSAYLDQLKAEADAIGRFLTRPETLSRIEAAFFAVDDPRLQQILSDGLRT
jgi:hypothetical protein